MSTGSVCVAASTRYCDTSSLRNAGITFTGWCRVTFNDFPRFGESYVPGILNFQNFFFSMPGLALL